jgi:aspartyl-tRNA synthetase
MSNIIKFPKPAANDVTQVDFNMSFFTDEDVVQTAFDIFENSCQNVDDVELLSLSLIHILTSIAESVPDLRDIIKEDFNESFDNL